MKNAILIPAFLFLAAAMNAQDLHVGDVSEYPAGMVSTSVDEKGDSVANLQFYTCVVVSEKTFKSAAEKAKWDKLKRDVKKAYPYAVLAKMKLAEMDAQLALIKGEKERCLQAGMDDYLSKPLLLNDLSAKINQWSSRPAEAAKTA